MVSGGADSACAAAGLAARARRRVGARAARQLRAARGRRRGRGGSPPAVRRAAHRPPRRAAAAARRAATSRRRRATLRYDAAERLRDRTGAAVIATGHTRTDVAETALYRLAASPGSRALLGLAPRSGRVVRPLLGLERERIRELALAAGLPFADDETNADPTFARNRIRAEVLPVLRDVNPAAEPQHRRDPGRARRGGGAARAGRARGARRGRRRRRRGRDPGRRARRGFEPALRRLALRALAERAAGAPVAARPRARGRDRAAGGDARGRRRSSSAPAWSRVCESGFVRFAAAAERRRPGARAGRPGASRAGAGRRWEVRAELHPGPGRAGRSRSRDARRRGARGADRGPHLARGRPHPPARDGRDQDARRPVHRPRRARARCAGRSRSSPSTAASPGWPASRSRRTSGSSPRPSRSPSSPHALE